MIVYLISFLLLATGVFYDHQVSTFFLNHQYVWLSKFMSIFALLGDGISVFIIISLIWIGVRKKLPATFWLAFGASMLVTYSLKIFFMRDRPFAIPGSRDMAQSFPSGHSTAVFSALPFFDGKWRYFWLVFSLLVVFSRVYQGYHYLTDVGAGMLIGYGISMIVKKYGEGRIQQVTKEVLGKDSAIN